MSVTTGMILLVTSSVRDGWPLKRDHSLKLNTANVKTVTADLNSRENKQTWHCNYMQGEIIATNSSVDFID